jgi:peptidoglycan/xylan/chitin deacetylase (PgdA/CDA1 family)
VSWGTPTPTFTYPAVGNNATKGASITLGSNSTGDARWQHAAVTVTPGATYTFSTWYKSDVATEVDVEYTKTAGGVSYDSIVDVVPASTVWKQITATFVIPAGMTKVSVFQLLDKKGTLTIDDVSLSSGNTVPPVVPPVVPPTPTTTPPVVPPAPTPGPFTQGMVTISFDDSWVTQYTNALPILQTAGLKGTFYLTTEPIQGGWTDFMTPTQVKDIAAKGHEIADHTVTHTDLTTLSTAAINNEIKNSKTYLENLTKTSVTSIAYPYGTFNTSIKTLAAQAGYSSARGVDDQTANVATSDKYELKSFCSEKSTPFSNIKARIDAAKANKQWFILCVHEVKNGGDQFSMTPAQFKQIVDYIKSSGIKVVTVKEGRALMPN